MARELTLVDAGLGNLASVERALIQVGSATQITDDPDKVATARTVVFPGQGAFGKTTDKIVSGAMGEALRMVIQRGDPFLGICLGMQLLFESSEEGGGRKGLGVLGGHCRRFPNDMTAVEGEHVRKLKIPHMGWNEVQPSGEHYYFVHSYYVDAERPEDVMWSTTYGDVTFAAAVRRDNVYGCQFHPEKSQQAGLRFLRAFLLGSRQ
jgi:glutamine amidotransferase